MPKKQQTKFSKDSQAYLTIGHSSKRTSINPKQKYITRKNSKVFYKNISKSATKWLEKVFALCQNYSLFDKVFRDNIASKNKNQVKNLNEQEAVALGQVMMKEILREEERRKQEYEIYDEYERQEKNEIKKDESSKISKTISFGLLNFIEATIKKLSTSLLIESIVCIVQTPCLFEGVSQKQVFVIFQSCYPTILVSKSCLKQIIKSEVYAEKKAKYKQILANNKEHGSLKNQNFAFCHKCLEPMMGPNAFVCNQKVNENLFNISYNTTDPTLFHNNFFEANFFTNIKAMILPYFIYRKDDKGRTYCNRVYCKKCREDSLVGKRCAVCVGNCNCRRCQTAYSIVKLLAGFKKEGGNMEQLFQQLPIHLLAYSSEYPIRYYQGEWQLKNVVRVSENKKKKQILQNQKSIQLAEGRINLETIEINITNDSMEQMDFDEKCCDKDEFQNVPFFDEEIAQIDIQIASHKLDEDSLFKSPID